MADLTHIFKVGQRVKCRMDEDIHDGVIKETFKDHVIIDIPDVLNHCWFENDLNIEDVIPVYNF